MLGASITTALYIYATPTPIAMSVNILSEPLWIDCQPRTKNGQPHQSTTGVLKRNCSQRDQSLATQVGAFGKTCAMPSTKTGNARTAPNQNRRVMSRSSAFSSSVAPIGVLGSSAMPQIG